MTNPYKLDFNGLNIIIYAENKEQAQMIFDQKISEHNERVKAEALAELSSISEVEAYKEGRADERKRILALLKRAINDISI